MSAALLREIDTQTVAMLSSWVGRSDALDRAVAALAQHLAKLHVLLLGLLLIGVDQASRQRHRATALRIALVLPLTIGVVAAVGRLVGRQRPFAIHESTTALLDHAPERSFPSRHAACAAAMATVALPGAPRIGLAMAVLGVVLALSRVYAGLHYLTDVVSGWAIGIALGLLVRQKGLIDGVTG
jgi:membrane-associated phospholipid phosphatase